jgi:cytosine/adenosine deaminase-related metal-dependent hydrolase
MAADRAQDEFERRYAAPVLAEQVDPRERTRERREGQARAAPDEPFALRGCLLTPDEAIDPGWLVVSGASVAELRDTAPTGMRVIDTEGVVLPGLIDLHGHPEYNVFPAWEPPGTFANRYAWRDSAEYAEVIKQPWSLLTRASDGSPSLLATLTRYAEARALIGGVTAIQGASAKYPDPHESLVRNVDLFVFGAHHGRSLIDPLRQSAKAAAALRAEIDRGDVRAVYVHLAEGVDDDSRAEFDRLLDLELVTPATVIIHGTALTDAQLAAVRERGGKLVWSPQSNLRLYGRTTAAARALALGIPTALGADWLPSGSPSLLDEIKIARLQLAQQGAPAAPKQLVALLTKEAARVAALDDRLGTLAPGRAADLLVLERHHADPWESVLLADRRSVELVTIGGDIAYGRRAWVEELAGTAGAEPVTAWGKPMALDLSFSVLASDGPPPRLAGLRAELLARYRQIGPIFA